MPAIFDGTDDYITYAHHRGAVGSRSAPALQRPRCSRFHGAGWVRKPDGHPATTASFADNTSGNTCPLRSRIRRVWPPISGVLIRGSTQSTPRTFTALDAWKQRANRRHNLARKHDGRDQSDRHRLRKRRRTVNTKRRRPTQRHPDWRRRMDHRRMLILHLPATARGSVKLSVTGWNSVSVRRRGCGRLRWQLTDGIGLLPLATNSTGYKTDGTTTFSGTESGGGITYRSAGLTGEGISAEWKYANLTGSVGQRCHFMGRDVDQCVARHGNRQRQVEVDAYPPSISRPTSGR